MDRCFDWIKAFRALGRERNGGETVLGFVHYAWLGVLGIGIIYILHLDICFMIPVVFWNIVKSGTRLLPHELG
jgi:hypothetical protein